MNACLRNTFAILAALSLLAGLSACGGPPSPTPLTSVVVQLAWTHQAESSGFYAAAQNGFYAEEGLDVTFLEGGPKVDPRQSVAEGRAQFGAVASDMLILARAEGKPLRAIATLVRRSPVVFITLADSGITRPEEFAGQTVRLVPNVAVAFYAMMAKMGIGQDEYTEVNLPSDVALFASGEAPVWGAYVSGLALTLQQAGYKLNIIYPDDYGVHFYGESIFTTDDLIARNPDLVRRFLRATLRGYTYAVENPAAVGLLVVKYKPEADAALETARMTTLLPLVNTGEDYIGWTKPTVWAGMEQTLREQGLLAQPVDVTQVYTLEFLEEIYQ